MRTRTHPLCFCTLPTSITKIQPLFMYSILYGFRLTDETLKKILCAQTDDPPTGCDFQDSKKNDTIMILRCAMDYNVYRLYKTYTVILRSCYNRIYRPTRTGINQRNLSLKKTDIDLKIRNIFLHRTVVRANLKNKNHN